MTRPTSFEQSDHSKGYQKADTHGSWSATSAARFASVCVNQSSARASESTPCRVNEGCSQDFHSPFEIVNEETMDCDQRSQAERILHAISLFCAAVLIAGILTLLYLNLFASDSPLSRGCGHDLGKPYLSPQMVAEVGIFPWPCR